MDSGRALPDWERLLAAERHLQHLVAGTVLVGGTAAAIHGQHRISMDGDHVLDGILTGIRQLRRTVPLETEIVSGLRVPTLAEMARIKAWLLVTRNTLRDYLDATVLFERLGEEQAVQALRPFDQIYRQSTGASPLAELSERLAAAMPKDRAEIDLKHYRGLKPPWDDWQYVAVCGRRWATLVASLALEEKE